MTAVIHLFDQAAATPPESLEGSSAGPQVPDRSPEAPEVPWLAGRRILVVEDEFVLALDVEAHLQAAGAVVVGPVASLTDAALLLAIARRLDAAVLDVNLGGELVYPLADVLMTSGVPIAFLTGYARKDLPERFCHVPLFEKPLAVQDLARTLKRKLGTTLGVGTASRPERRSSHTSPG